MTHLSLSKQNPEFIKIESDSKTLIEWLKGSPSRVWKSGEFFYPITELTDLLDFCSLVSLPIKMEEPVQLAHNNFMAKLQLLSYYKSKNDLSDSEFKSFDDAPLFKGELFDYQKPVIAQMLLMRKYLLSLEVGLGKTVVAAYAICLLKRIKPSLRVLIICEANQLHKPWLETIYKLTKIKEITVLQGTSDQRVDTIHSAEAKKNWLWITTYDTIRIEKDRLDKDWDIIIMDEITKIKNISTLISKSLRDFSARYIWGLSATPVMNTFYDLYGIMKIVNPTLFTNKENYTNRYLILDYFGRPKKLNKLTIGELTRKMFPWMIQKTKTELGLQKPIHIITYPVELVPTQIELLNEVQDELDEGRHTAFEVQTRLRQICNSSKLLEKYEDIPLEESTKKLEVVKAIIEEVVDTQKKNIIVFSYFVPIVNWLNDYFGRDYSSRVIQGTTKKTCKFSKQQDCFKCSIYTKCKSVKKYVHEFNAGKVEILFGTDSMSRSHDLRTCDSIINFDLPWSAGDLTQRIGRIERKVNPAKEFFVYNVATLGTIEEKIIKIIETKEKEVNMVFPKYAVSLSKLSNTIRVKTL